MVSRRSVGSDNHKDADNAGQHEKDGEPGVALYITIHIGDNRADKGD